MTKLSLVIEQENDKDGKFKFVSEIEDNKVYESRANDIANILSYDSEHYHDVNIETIIRAATIAGLIKKETK